ncbi:MAG TPA: response regulator, partial [Xanthobacteraceae bacterium]|nr:response regulator [Xanthobacteraceae bacterium]
DLHRQRVLIAAAPIAAPLIARRLECWGAFTRVAVDPVFARALLQDEAWDVLIGDRALGTETLRALATAASSVHKRIVLLSPGERGELGLLAEAGFANYLIKPIRRASLAAILGSGEDSTVFPPHRADAEIGAAMAAARGSLKILVAEDNEINALLTRSLLEKLGHYPAVVGDGAAAYDAWKAAVARGAPFDLVLLDVQMPVMDGIDAARRIRAAEAAAGVARTPIVAVSANAFVEDRETCMAAGMDGFLVKPLDRDQLAAWLVHARGTLAA